MSGIVEGHVRNRGSASSANQGEALLYRRIQAEMRTRISAGNWAAGHGIPNRTLLCKEFGTTRVTLDKAIQGLVAEGLLRSSGRIGTFVALPEEIATRTLRIGVILASDTVEPHDLSGYHENFYFGPLFQGIRDGVSGKPVETTYSHLHHTEYLKFCRDVTPDGLILIAPRGDQLPVFHSLYRAGIYFVAVGISSGAPIDIDIPCQDTDNRQGARDAALHLIDLGHRDIAIVTAITKLTNLNDRQQGFCQTLQGAGVELDPSNVVLIPEPYADGYEEFMNDWLSRAVAAKTVPTAIFVGDYPMTLTVLRVLRRHGLRVPDDISVVGFDDPLSAEHLTPPLTTVRQPVYEMGRRATERLLAGVRDRVRPNGTERLRTELIIRESTGRVRSA